VSDILERQLGKPGVACTSAFAVDRPAEGTAARSVDYRHLGAEELGSVFESLLKMIPRCDPITQTLSLEATAGHRQQDQRQLLHTN
jgi:hypothetical protein